MFVTAGDAGESKGGLTSGWVTGRGSSFAGNGRQASGQKRENEETEPERAKLGTVLH